MLRLQAVVLPAAINLPLALLIIAQQNRLRGATIRKLLGLESDDNKLLENDGVLYYVARMPRGKTRHWTMLWKRIRMV